MQLVVQEVAFELSLSYAPFFFPVVSCVQDLVQLLPIFFLFFLNPRCTFLLWQLLVCLCRTHLRVACFCTFSLVVKHDKMLLWARRWMLPKHFPLVLAVAEMSGTSTPHTRAHVNAYGVP